MTIVEERRGDHCWEKVADGMTHHGKAVCVRSLFVFPIDLLDNDDGIVNNQPYRSGHCPEQHDIDGNTGQIAKQDTEGHGDWNSEHHH